MAELQRLLLSPKRLIILLMAAVINLALFSGYCRTEREQSVSYYNSMKMQGRNMRAEEYRDTKKYLETDYPNYLDYVQHQTQTQSILSSLGSADSFVERNAEKSARDYQKLGSLTLQDGENRGVNAVRNYAITDYMLLIAPLLLILEMLADADTAVGDLTRSTKQGRVPLCTWRILAVCIIAAASVLMLYGGNILYTCNFYGSPTFSRPIQSIPEYQVCPLRLTIGEYLLAAGCLKIAALTVTALFIWVILARFHALLGWLISGVWLGGSWLLYRIVIPTAKLNHLKFLNVFASLDAHIFFTQYCNLNWFGHPVGFLGNMVLFAVILLIAAVLLCLWLIGHAYPKKTGQRIEALKDKFARFMARHLPVHTLFGCEGWKLLIAQKGLLVLLLTALMGFSLWKDIRIYVPVNAETERFYSRFSGEVTQEKLRQAAYIVVGEYNSIQRDRIALAKKYLVKAAENQDEEIQRQKEQNPYYQTQNDRDIARINGYIEKSRKELQSYKPLLDSMLSLARYTRETGQDAWFIQQDVYLVLFRDSAAERRCCMVLLICLIFAFSGIGAYDNRYDTRMLLRSTKRGRAGIFTAQTAWVMLLTALAVTGLHGVYLLHMMQDAGLPSLDAPAQSIKMFRWIPFSMTVRGLIICHMILRYLAALAVTAGIRLISRLSRTPEKALLTSMVVFLLPSALAESGITQLNILNIVRFLTCCTGE